MPDLGVNNDVSDAFKTISGNYVDIVVYAWVKGLGNLYFQFIYTFTLTTRLRFYLIRPGYHFTKALRR